MKKRKILNESLKIFWIFMIGSVFGYIFETVSVILQTGHYEIRQGLIYGPFIPVYGIGAIIYYIIFKKVKIRNKLLVFLISMLLGGITEYICSYVQEMAFHTISWDYSYLPFNLQGRTSLLHCTYWGIAGILYITGVEPFIDKIEKILKSKIAQIITIIIALFMIFNIAISCITAIRQRDRLNNIKPRNVFEELLDKYYPDEYLNKIFCNRKNV